MYILSHVGSCDFRVLVGVVLREALENGTNGGDSVSRFKNDTCGFSVGKEGGLGGVHKTYRLNFHFFEEDLGHLSAIVLVELEVVNDHDVTVLDLGDSKTVFHEVFPVGLHLFPVIIFDSASFDGLT